MTRIYIIVIVVVLLVVSLGACGFLYKKWRETEGQNKELIQYSSGVSKKLTTYTNNYNRLVYKTRATEFSNKTLRRLLKEGELKNETKQFKKIPVNKIAGLGFIHIVAVDTLSTELIGDSSFHVHNEFKDVTGEIKNGRISITDSVNVPLDIIVHWQRTWFLAKKHYFTEVTSENPGVIIGEIKTIIKKD